MTGRELKKFSEMIHDHAVVQIDWGDGYRTDWKELKPAEIQATLKPAESLDSETVRG